MNDAARTGGAPCPCVPGEVIGCDEVCRALVFCAPASTRVCLPDGTWGPCREALLATLGTNLLCPNLFNGCLGKNEEGVFVGACKNEFSCGHAPGGGVPNETADAGAPATDAATPLLR